MLMGETDPQATSANFIKIISMLPRKGASIIMQLRTGHIPLAKYLTHIGKIPSLICPACLQATKTVHHFILICPAYQNTRQTLHFETGGGTIDIHRLLTKPKPMKALIKFVSKTKRLARLEEIPFDLGNPQQD